MRIGDTPPPSDPSLSSNNDDVEPVQDEEMDGDPSPFSKLMAKKKGLQEDSESKKKPGGAGQGESSSSGFRDTDRPLDSVTAAEQVESKRSVTLPTQLQQLVKEISVVVNASGTEQVHIDLNSKLFKGLHIQIERQEGTMLIQFQTSSDDVSRLLSRNIDSLVEGLSDRGVNGADIRISGPQSRNEPGRSSFASRWQGGRQGGRR